MTSNLSPHLPNNSSKNSSSKNNNKSLTPYPPNQPKPDNPAPTRRRFSKKAKATGKKSKRAKKSIKRLKKK